MIANEMRHVLITGWLLACAALPTAAAWAQTRDPYTPSEEALKRKLSGVHHDRGSGHQARAVETVSGKAREGAQWVRDKLAKLYITPARLMIGLGVLGVLFCWNRNKRKLTWLVLTLGSWLMLGVGVAAIALDWPLLA